MLEPSKNGVQFMPWKKICLSLVCLLFSCEDNQDVNQPLGNNNGGQNAVAEGNRTLGVTVIPAEDGNDDEAMNIAREAGIAVTNLSLNWRDIETAPGV